MMRKLSARMLFGIDLFGFTVLRVYIATGILVALVGLPKPHPLWICELMETLTNDLAGDATVDVAAKMIFFAGWIVMWIACIGFLRLRKRISHRSV
ncbi:hypothetical protein AB4Y43_16825 [Paraburkholderia sp. BR10872]|uniref:hypothetical protein n=1 Tax=Paraburkholderia sp. BR10872 TaxID=3236989 RepID=UPI0034D257E6